MAVRVPSLEARRRIWWTCWAPVQVMNRSDRCCPVLMPLPSASAVFTDSPKLGTRTATAAPAQKHPVRGRFATFSRSSGSSVLRACAQISEPVSPPNGTRGWAGSQTAPHHQEQNISCARYDRTPRFSNPLSPLEINSRVPTHARALEGDVAVELRWSDNDTYVSLSSRTFVRIIFEPPSYLRFLYVQHSWL